MYFEDNKLLLLFYTKQVAVMLQAYLEYLEGSFSPFVDFNNWYLPAMMCKNTHVRHVQIRYKKLIVKATK